MKRRITLQESNARSKPVVRNEERQSNPSINRRLEEGHYANFFQIGHNAFEFLIEFGQQEGEQAAIHTRIYVSPQHARILPTPKIHTAPGAISAADFARSFKAHTSSRDAAKAALAEMEQHIAEHGCRKNKAGLL
jgi:Protein of unknown function (DUF3467)